MWRPMIWLLLGLIATGAQAQERERCNWCGCKGGPGYRIQDSAAPQYAKRVGNCVSHRDLARVCGTPPTTHCAYEGNRASPGATPPNPPLDRQTRTRTVPAGEPAHNLVPALTE